MRDLMIPLRRLASLVPMLGLRTALDLVFKERLTKLVARAYGRDPVHSTYRIHVPRSRDTVLCRAVSSDRRTFQQVFEEGEYRDLLDPALPNPVIVDAGANVGYTSVLFLTSFPGASVIAIEPDPRNFAMLERNLAPWSHRVRLVRGALWPTPGSITIRTHAPGALQEWASYVDGAPHAEQADGDAIEVTAIDPPSLVALAPNNRIDLMKIDIEGAELALFAHDDLSWVDQVDGFGIELHGPECEAAFRAAVAGTHVITGRSVEVTRARRIVADA